MIDYVFLNANTEPLKTAVPTIANVTATLQPVTHKCMGVLYIKVIFFILPCRNRTHCFAFTWEGVQYPFNRFPQGYKPTINTTAH